MRRIHILASTALVVAACGRNPENDTGGEPVPPPAAEFAPVRENMRLDEKLGLMQADLERALQDGLNDAAITRIYRAEAISDRLLETAPPFTWLRQAYATESRLRQLQALSDRVVAEFRRGMEREAIRPDVERLLKDVRGLRTELAAGGGTKPPTLDSLMAGFAADTLAEAGADAGAPD